MASFLLSLAEHRHLGICRMTRLPRRVRKTLSELQHAFPSSHSFAVLPTPLRQLPYHMVQTTLAQRMIDESQQRMLAALARVGQSVSIGSSWSVIWQEAMEELREQLQFIEATWDGSIEIPRWIVACVIELSTLGVSPYPSWDRIATANVDCQPDHPWLHPSPPVVNAHPAMSVMATEGMSEEEGESSVRQEDKKSQAVVPEDESGEQQPARQDEEAPMDRRIDKGKAREVDPEAQPMPVTGDSKGKGKAVDKLKEEDEEPTLGHVDKGKAREVDPEAPPMPLKGDAKGKGKGIDENKEEEEEPSRGRSRTLARGLTNASGSSSNRGRSVARSTDADRSEIAESSARAVSAAGDNARPPCGTCRERELPCKPQIRSKACDLCFRWKIKCSWVAETRGRSVSRPRGRTKSRPRPAEPSGSISPSVKPKTPRRSSTKKKSQAAEPALKAETREEAPKASQPKTPAATRRRRRSQSPESSNNPSTSLGNEEQPSAPKRPRRESKGLQPATPTIKSYLVELSTKGPKAHGTVKKTLVFDGVEILTKNPRPRILPTRSPAPGPSSSSDIYPPTTSATSGSSEVQRLAEECDRLRRDNMALENRVRLLESGLKTFGNVLKARFPDLNDARLAFPFANSSQTAESSNAGFAKTLLKGHVLDVT
ncbi:hypothetical protein L210DRAFT_3651777 [Boletus edulis BED1]|uniref:Zn(2)-C6 fungal-type domain-containing protein n=1 Tax=Boletus edulis BED1 TaxID=1328754 RepID=A0AAD4BHX7_BOLED|nr:hypothetical protein L210DRAFT_3651777 [Boletus edulis BED1]